MKLNNKKQCPPDSLRIEIFARSQCCRQAKKDEARHALFRGDETEFINFKD